MRILKFFLFAAPLIIALALLLEISYRGYKFCRYYLTINNLGSPLIEAVDIKDRQEYRLRPNSQVMADSGTVYSINSRGLRDYEYAYEKKEGAYRILVLGDSYVFGWELDLEESFPKKLERIFQKNYPGKKVEVINGGVYGYNTVQEYEFLKKELIKYNPDLVILGFVVNDAEPSFGATNNPVMQYRGVNLWFPEFLKYRLNILIYKMFKKDYFFKLKRQGMSYHQWEGFTEENEIWKKKECLEALGNIDGLLKKEKIDFFVMIYPDFGLFPENNKVPPYGKEYRYGIIHDTVSDFCRSRNIVVLDLYGSFYGMPVGDIRQKEKISYFHFNEKGQSIAAEEVFKYLNNNRIVD